MKCMIVRFFPVIFVIFFFSGTGLLATELNQEDGIFPSHSAEYVRTLNRNASTDADASFYNPAGLAMMEKTGLYINFSNQTLYKKRTHTMDFYQLDISTNLLGIMPIEISQPTENPGIYSNMARGGLNSDDSYYMEITAPAMPDLNLVYRGKNFGQDWAAYLSLGIMQAAPDVTFPRGLATVDWGNLTMGEQLNAVNNELLSLLGLSSHFKSYTYETNVAVRTEYYIGGTAGLAYQVIDMLSTAVGFRYIYYTGRQTIKVTGVDESFSNSLTQTLFDGVKSDWDIDTEYTGHGYGIITGIDLRPINALNIGIRYEYYLPATVTKKTKSFLVSSLLEGSGQLDIFKDGTANEEYDSGDGYAHGSGVSKLKVTYPQSLSAGISLQVLKSLRLETGGDVYFRNKVDLDGIEDHYNLGYRVGGCVEYSVNDSIKVSTGYSYNDTGIKNSFRNEIDPLLDNHSIGLGTGIKINDRLEFNFGILYIYYVPATVYSRVEADATMDLGEQISDLLYLSGLIPDGTVTMPVHSTSYIKKKLAEETFIISVGMTYRLFGDSGKKETEDKKAKLQL